MKRRVTESLGFLKTTAIGGIFFLLPLVVTGVVVGHVASIIWSIATAISDYIPVGSAIGYSFAVLVATAVVVCCCFAAGVIASRQIAKRFSSSIEKYVLMLFPRYAILKEQLTGNIGGDVMRSQLQPVLVRFPGHSRLGFEIERSGGHADGSGTGRESVTVYLPGSPDPWNGEVVILQAHLVEQVHSPFSETVATFEQLGRDSQRLIERYRGGYATTVDATGSR